MVKSQKINRKKKNSGPVVVDNRSIPQPSIPTEASQTNAPIRTVHLVEVGNMDAKQIQLLLQRLNAAYSPAKDGVQYFLPIRHGKIGSDIVFEKEFEELARRLFEVVDRDGEPIEGAIIQLKGGAKDVEIVRQRI